MIRVLFVCLGNICRSPLAEGLLLKLLAEKGYSQQVGVDSAGTSAYHIGQPADARTLRNAAAHQVHLPSRARQISFADFYDFDYILTADNAVHKMVLHQAQAAQKQHQAPIKAQIALLRPFGEPAESAVPDPYYGGEEGFEAVFQILTRATQGFFNHLQQTHFPD
ncbi:low molecular weight protein-tyrosine-phosphatase [Hugenholtzia roseola]|uniref:low molecular weight protein-tyrosine-phosphatase n=1 Tax=Hugenholtzia roseola TaxID=1002 RepID=UPI000550764A|nr:low molecular weight protein-tyrosine-phosphatase [Hugenholtzia roseola]